MTVVVPHVPIIVSNMTLFPLGQELVVTHTNGPIKERKTVLELAEQMESGSNLV